MLALELTSPFGRLERLVQPDQIPSWEQEWLDMAPPGRWSHYPEWASWKAALATLMRDTRRRYWEHLEKRQVTPTWLEQGAMMAQGLQAPGIPAPLPHLDEGKISVVSTRMGPILIESQSEILIQYLEGPTALLQAHLVDLEGLHPLPPATITLLGDSDPLDRRQSRLWGWGALYHQRLYRLWTPDPSGA
jgi:hypothetical protein